MYCFTMSWKSTIQVCKCSFTEHLMSDDFRLIWNVLCNIKDNTPIFVEIPFRNPLSLQQNMIFFVRSFAAASDIDVNLMQRFLLLESTLFYSYKMYFTKPNYTIFVLDVWVLVCYYKGIFLFLMLLIKTLRTWYPRRSLIDPLDIHT